VQLVEIFAISLAQRWIWRLGSWRERFGATDDGCSMRRTAIAAGRGFCTQDESGESAISNSYFEHCSST